MNDASPDTLVFMRRRRVERADQYENPTYLGAVRRLATNTHYFRQRNGWNQEEAAHQCEMSTRLYQHVEHASANVTLTTLARLCIGFHLDISQLFQRRRRRFR
jgi:DNA-binding XRE family transcriptional regulator